MTGLKSESITFKKLKGKEDYRDWSRRMLLVLDDEDASDYVRESKEKPSKETPKQDIDEDSTAFETRYKQWQEDTKDYNRQNKKARTKIGLLVEPGPFKHIDTLDDHLKSWNKLKEVYSIQDFTLPILYLGQMSDCRLENCKNMTEYTTKIKDLWEQINDSDEDTQLGEWVALSFVLKNLTDAYSQWITVKYEALRKKETHPTLENLIVELIAEEHRIQTSNISDANFTRKGNEGRKRQNKPNCQDCKKAGRKSSHDPEKCWVKYPNLKPDRIKEKEKKEKGNDPKPSQQQSSKLQLLATSTVDQPISNVNAVRSTAVWYWDSGCQDHICIDRSILYDVTPSTYTMRAANGTLSKAICKGKTTLRADIDGKEIQIELTDVHCVPGFDVNLFSHRRAREKGVKIVENNKTINLELRGETICYIDDHNSLYSLRLATSKSYVVQANPDKADLHTWHRRLGHMNYRYVKEARKAVKGLVIDELRPPPATCESCIVGKQHREMNKYAQETATELGDLITTDLVGAPSMIPDIVNGARYGVILTDYAKKFTWVRIVQIKD